MVVLRELQERIQKQIATTRARLAEFFEGYDRHKIKQVTFSQAIRSLNSFCKIDLSPDEVEALRVYCTPRGDFRYQDFCDDIDTVFTTKGLERNPGAVPENPLTTTRLRQFGASDMSSEELEDLAALLDSMAEAVRVRGVLVKAFFRDFDRHNAGFVTRHQFFREIRSCFPFVTEGDIDLLARRYGDGKDVNYRQLHLDVTEDAAAPGRPMPGYSTTAGARRSMAAPGDASAVDSSAVEARIIRQVATRRIRAKEFFTEFDRLRSGVVTEAQFQRALTACKLVEVSEADLRALTARYADRARPGMVRYTEFLATLDEATTKAGLEKMPTATLDSHARAIAQAPKRAPPKLTHDEEVAAHTALADIKRIIRERRITLVPLFKDFDRSNEEYVSRDQFLRVLRIESLMPSDGAAIEAVVKRFEGVGDRAGRIDWRSFNETVDPPSKVQQEAPRPEYHPVSVPSDVAEVMHRIKTRALKDKLRVEEFLRDYNVRGCVTKHQLEAGLGAASLRLSFEDVDALAAAYADVSAVDAAGQPMVAWRRFVDDVNLVFTQPGLERDPGADPDAVATMAKTGALGLPSASTDAVAPRGDLLGSSRLTAAEQAQLKDVLKDVEYHVMSRRLEIVPAFQDFDRHKRGYVSLAQFKRALASLALPLSDEDTDLVVKAFRMPHSDRVDINYQWFVGAIDAVDGFLHNLPGANEAPTLAGASLRRGAAPFVPPSPSRTRGGGSGGGAGAGAGLPSADAVVALLTARCAEKGVKMVDFFQDYDRLRHGHLPQAKFRTALATAGMHFSAAQLEALEAGYRNVAHVGHVNWRDLSRVVDGGEEGLEKAPLAEMHKRTTRRLTNVRGPDAVDTDNADVERLVASVAAAVSTRRVNLKPQFQAFDRLRHQKVPKHRFAGILQREHLVAQPQDIQVLCDVFEAEAATDAVNYAAFLRAVDKELIQ